MKKIIVYFLACTMLVGGSFTAAPAQAAELD
jgi:hypothetical protein